MAPTEIEVGGSDERDCDPSAEFKPGYVSRGRTSEPPNLQAASLPIVGRRVSLRPVTPGDTPFIMEMELTGPNAVAYRHRGQAVSPEQFQGLLWHGVLCQFIVVRNGDQMPCGLVVCYGADFRNGHASIAAIFRPDLHRAVWPLEGIDLFFEYIFTVFPMRKLYAESSGLTNSNFASGLSPVLKCEATLREHDWFDGRYWDKHIYAIYRDEWRAHMASASHGGLADAVHAAANEPTEQS